MMSKILIIEDDEFIRESTADVLREEGFEVIVAENGMQGILKALMELPDLVLSDISMGETDGYEVFKALKENERTASIPFIFLTAHSEKDDFRMGMQLGADDYITKPFDFDDLLNAIRVRLAKYGKILKSSRDWYLPLLENSLVGIVLLTDGKIGFINAKFLKVLGYADENLIDHYFLNHIHEPDRALVEEKLSKCSRGMLKKCQISIAFKSKLNHLMIPADLFLSVMEIKPEVNITCIIKEYSVDTKLEEKVFFTEDMMDAFINFISDRKHQLKDKQMDSLMTIFNPQAKQDLITLNVDTLTKREIEILTFICNGFTNQEIANRLFISQRTVDSHRSSLLQKTSSSNTAELIVFAIRNHLFAI